MSNVTFYVCAHQDDWQLFRGEVAYSDIQSAQNSLGDRVVFIYVTAGDAGGFYGPGWWGARELGALESCRKVTGPQPFIWSVRTFTTTSTNYRPITSCSCGNTISYFLRLPDVRLEDMRLRSATLQAVDGSTAYASWSDLCETIQDILNFEKANANAVRPWVNTSDYDESKNQNSNPDHLSVGHAVLNATATGYNRVWWIDYFVEYLDENVSPEDIQRKTDLQKAYTDKIYQITGEAGAAFDDWSENGGRYTTWIKRSHARGDLGG